MTIIGSKAGSYEGGGGSYNPNTGYVQSSPLPTPTATQLALEAAGGGVGALPGTPPSSTVEAARVYSPLPSPLNALYTTILPGASLSGGSITMQNVPVSTTPVGAIAAQTATPGGTSIVTTPVTTTETSGESVSGGTPGTIGYDTAALSAYYKAFQNAVENSPGVSSRSLGNAITKLQATNPTEFQRLANGQFTSGDYSTYLGAPQPIPAGLTQVDINYLINSGVLNSKYLNTTNSNNTVTVGGRTYTTSALKAIYDLVSSEVANQNPGLSQTQVYSRVDNLASSNAQVLSGGSYLINGQYVYATNPQYISAELSNGAKIVKISDGPITDPNLINFITSGQDIGLYITPLPPDQNEPQQHRTEGEKFNEGKTVTFGGEINAIEQQFAREIPQIISLLPLESIVALAKAKISESDLVSLLDSLTPEQKAALNQGKSYAIYYKQADDTIGVIGQSPFLPPGGIQIGTNVSFGANAGNPFSNYRQGNQALTAQTTSTTGANALPPIPRTAFSPFEVMLPQPVLRTTPINTRAPTISFAAAPVTTTTPGNVALTAQTISNTLGTPNRVSQGISALDRDTTAISTIVALLARDIYNDANIVPALNTFYANNTAELQTVSALRVQGYYSAAQADYLTAQLYTDRALGTLGLISDRIPLINSAAGLVASIPQVQNLINGTPEERVIGLELIVGYAMAVAYSVESISISEVATTAGGVAYSLNLTNLAFGTTLGAALQPAIGAATGQTTSQQIAHNILEGINNGAFYTSAFYAVGDTLGINDVIESVAKSSPGLARIGRTALGGIYGFTTSNLFSFISGNGPAGPGQDLFSTVLGSAIPAGLDTVSGGYEFGKEQFSEGGQAGTGSAARGGTFQGQNEEGLLYVKFNTEEAPEGERGNVAIQTIPSGFEKLIAAGAQPAAYIPGQNGVSGVVTSPTVQITYGGGQPTFAINEEVAPTIAEKEAGYREAAGKTLYKVSFPTLTPEDLAQGVIRNIAIAPGINANEYNTQTNIFQTTPSTVSGYYYIAYPALNDISGYSQIVGSGTFSGVPVAVSMGNLPYGYSIEGNLMSPFGVMNQGGGATSELSLYNLRNTALHQALGDFNIKVNPIGEETVPLSQGIVTLNQNRPAGPAEVPAEETNMGINTLLRTTAGPTPSQGVALDLGDLGKIYTEAEAETNTAPTEQAAKTLPSGGAISESTAEGKASATTKAQNAVNTNVARSIDILGFAPQPAEGAITTQTTATRAATTTGAGESTIDQLLSAFARGPQIGTEVTPQGQTSLSYEITPQVQVSAQPTQQPEGYFTTLPRVGTPTYTVTGFEGGPISEEQANLNTIQERTPPPTRVTISESNANRGTVMEIIPKEELPEYIEPTESKTTTVVPTRAADVRDVLYTLNDEQARAFRSIFNPQATEAEDTNPGTKLGTIGGMGKNEAEAATVKEETNQPATAPTVAVQKPAIENEIYALDRDQAQAFRSIFAPETIEAPEPAVTRNEQGYAINPATGRPYNILATEQTQEEQNVKSLLGEPASQADTNPGTKLGTIGGVGKNEEQVVPYQLNEQQAQAFRSIFAPETNAPQEAAIIRNAQGYAINPDTGEPYNKAANLPESTTILPLQEFLAERTTAPEKFAEIIPQEERLEYIKPIASTVTEEATPIRQIMVQKVAVGVPQETNYLIQPNPLQFFSGSTGAGTSIETYQNPLSPLSNPQYTITGHLTEVPSEEGTELTGRVFGPNGDLFRAVIIRPSPTETEETVNAQPETKIATTQEPQSPEERAAAIEAERAAGKAEPESTVPKVVTQPTQNIATTAAPGTTPTAPATANVRSAATSETEQGNAEAVATREGTTGTKRIAVNNGQQGQAEQLERLLQLAIPVPPTSINVAPPQQGLGFVTIYPTQVGQAQQVQIPAQVTKVQVPGSVTVTQNNPLLERQLERTTEAVAPLQYKYEESTKEAVAPPQYLYGQQYLTAAAQAVAPPEVKYAEAVYEKVAPSPFKYAEAENIQEAVHPPQYKYLEDFLEGTKSKQQEDELQEQLESLISIAVPPIIPPPPEVPIDLSIPGGLGKRIITQKEGAETPTVKHPEATEYRPSLIGISRLTPNAQEQARITLVSGFSPYEVRPVGQAQAQAIQSAFSTLVPHSVTSPYQTIAQAESGAQAAQAQKVSTTAANNNYTPLPTSDPLSLLQQQQIASAYSTATPQYQQQIASALSQNYATQRQLNAQAVQYYNEAIAAAPSVYANQASRAALWNSIINELYYVSPGEYAEYTQGYNSGANLPGQISNPAIYGGAALEAYEQQLRAQQGAMANNAPAQLNAFLLTPQPQPTIISTGPNIGASQKIELSKEQG